jgi:hypothetical protein
LLIHGWRVVLLADKIHIRARAGEQRIQERIKVSEDAMDYAALFTMLLQQLANRV